MVSIWITEVGPRDGLQNEPAFVPTEMKIAFIHALAETGVPEIEVTSFVSPRWVPQLADAEEVFRGLTRKPNVVYSALVPNMRGMERALSVGVRKIAVFTAASETFNRKNTNASIEASYRRFRPVIDAARQHGVFVRAYISTAFYCPYEGKIDPAQTVRVAERLLELGVDELSIGDTIGRAVPRDVRALLDLLLDRVPVEKVVLHFHDTYGMAIANVLTAWEEYGVVRFDASAGGLGGCPYAPGASGNVATEDVVYALRASGASIDVDIQQIVRAVEIIRPYIQRPLQSRVGAVYRGRAEPATR